MEIDSAMLLKISGSHTPLLTQNLEKIMKENSVEFLGVVGAFIRFSFNYICTQFTQ